MTEYIVGTLSIKHKTLTNYRRCSKLLHFSGQAEELVAATPYPILGSGAAEDEARRNLRSVPLNMSFKIFQTCSNGVFSEILFLQNVRASHLCRHFPTIESMYIYVHLRFEFQPESNCKLQEDPAAPAAPAEPTADQEGA